MTLGLISDFREYYDHCFDQKECSDVLKEHYQAHRTERDRKDMGRHYTPKHLARAVTKMALKPNGSPDAGWLKHLAAVQQLPVDQQLQAVLNFHTCDPAAGSGNFLVQAAKEIGIGVARILFQSKVLDARQVEAGMSLATQNCIYGVDRDPLAVELCKLALWLNATEHHILTELPLPTLPNIRCGDSLVGVLELSVLKEGIPDGFYKPNGLDDKAVAAAYRKQNKQERSRHTNTATSGSLQILRDACDVYTAACFVKKLPDAPVPTTATLGAVLNQCLTPQQEAIVQHCRETSQRLRFFHWKLEFPEVFLKNAKKAI
jgi:hypothetical protein